MVSLGKMPLLNDYSLCTQTVTVYHYEGGEVTRTVYDKAFIDFKKTQNIENTGSTEVNDFLLVIPGGSQSCYVGDKVMIGEGATVPSSQDNAGETTTEESQGVEQSGTQEVDIKAWWRSFIPSKVNGLLVVKYADVKYWDGSIVHTEAGG